MALLQLETDTNRVLFHRSVKICLAGKNGDPCSETGGRNQAVVQGDFALPAGSFGEDRRNTGALPEGRRYDFEKCL